MSGGPDLERFLAAQDEGTHGDRYDVALAELRAGRKRGHWVWYVLPQLAGLGRSPTAQRFGVAGRAEARAYADHPVLGARLRECARVLLDLAAAGRADPEAVLGPVDAVKLRSSMTLFAAAVPDEPVFGAVLDAWFAGERDPETLRRL